MLREIDPDNIEASDRKLVSFGTRNTLSSQDDPVRGIGAARDWIFSEFPKYAADSGGRMTVALDSYLQPVASRIPVPTVITNVVATLRGTQPESANRDLRRQRPLRLDVHEPDRRRPATRPARTTTPRASRPCWRWRA